MIALGVSVFLAMFALQSASDLFGINKPEGEVTFELPENLSLSEIAALLKEDGVITQPLTFQLYAGLKNDAEDLLPGTYTLNTNMGYDEIPVSYTHLLFSFTGSAKCGTMGVETN